MSLKNGKPRTVIFDIDGVLACNLHRIHHVHDDRENPNWEAFYASIEEDPVLPHARVIREFYWVGHHEVILLTNRPEEFREHTIRWLEKNNIFYDELLMRDGTYLDSKLGHLEKLKKTHDVTLIFEDDPEHCKLLEEHGWPVMQVHSGYYDEGRVPDDKII